VIEKTLTIKTKGGIKRGYVIEKTLTIKTRGGSKQ